VKKAYISPVTSLLMSLSLALGILVSDLRGYKLLTSAHAQESPCGEPSDFGGGTIILSGIEVSGLSVNGQLVEQGVIAGSVQLINSTIAYEDSGDTSGVVVGGGNSPAPSGVVVGGGNIIIAEGEAEGGSPCTEGVVVGGGNGVVVGGGNSPAPSGVVVGGGTVIGGLLTCDDINITNGVISGTNLVLTGATINTGSIY
jgi:hypothetical protein